MSSELIKVEWDAPPNVHAWQTTIAGGVSKGGYKSLNLASTVGDADYKVEKNRTLLIKKLGLPEEPRWLRLVHGNKVLDAHNIFDTPEADASYSSQNGQVLLIPTADCLPVLFVSKYGDEVAAAHAGWRGLSAGILENTLAKFRCSVADVTVWFGPAIGPTQFEVGRDVFDAFFNTHPGSESAFVEADMPGKFMADIYGLGRHALEKAGVKKFFGGGFCTVSDERFFSYRRQGKESGRMGSLIWFT